MFKGAGGILSIGDTVRQGRELLGVSGGWRHGRHFVGD